MDNQNSNNEEYMYTNTINKFENHLLSIRVERQQMILPNAHSVYNERHQKIIEMTDWTLNKYRKAANTKKAQQKNGRVIIDNIIDNLEKKRKEG
jgi:hypothetical protein